MAVFRVERKHRIYSYEQYHHLRNKELSLKAKGLLSQMLSCRRIGTYPCGTVYINREKIDALSVAVRELEEPGYIQRSRERDERKERLRERITSSMSNRLTWIYCWKIQH